MAAFSFRCGYCRCKIGYIYIYIWIFRDSRKRLQISDGKRWSISSLVFMQTVLHGRITTKSWTFQLGSERTEIRWLVFDSGKSLACLHDIVVLNCKGIQYNLSLLAFIRCHDMETLSELLVLCEGNPPVTDWFPLRKGVNDVELWCFRCCNTEQDIEQTTVWPSFETPWRCFDVIVIWNDVETHCPITMLTLKNVGRFDLVQSFLGALFHYPGIYM